MDTANTEGKGELEANGRCLASVLNKEIHSLGLKHDIYNPAFSNTLFIV